MNSVTTTRLLGVLTLATAGLLTACRQESPAPTAPPPAEVTVLTVAAKRVLQITELPGRISPTREAQVRARATGILLKRRFEEGADVQEGQVLFEIDALPLQATLASAQAAAAKSEASLKDSQARAARYQELVKINAVSKQIFDEATATLAQNEADLLAAKASVRTAELNLGYTQVTAPIAGRIGKALVTEGALVSAQEATQLAVIRQLDPIYFDYTQSSTEVLHLKHALESGALQTPAAGEAGVTVILEDGTVFPHPGKSVFSDTAVDPTTGMIGLRAVLPNPQHTLLPGMFARARIVEGINTNAITVPQRTLQRSGAGAATVLVVSPDNNVEARSLQIDRTLGNDVIIRQGLKVGERIIVEGVQKAPPGSVVRPVPFTAPADAPATPAKSN